MLPAGRTMYGSDIFRFNHVQGSIGSYEVFFAHHKLNTAKGGAQQGIDGYSILVSQVAIKTLFLQAGKQDVYVDIIIRGAEYEIVCGQLHE